MFKKFYPTVSCESAYKIDFRKLYDKGYRGLLTDVDNTLVRHGAPSDEHSEALFVLLRKIGWKVCIISNNNEDRVWPFAERSQSPYICDAHKPSAAGYIEGMSKIGTNKDNTLMIGDQLFTDIYGANKAGIKSILVKPIHIDHKPTILLKRAGELIVKFFYRIYSKKHGEEL